MATEDNFCCPFTACRADFAGILWQPHPSMLIGRQAAGRRDKRVVAILAAGCPSCGPAPWHRLVERHGCFPSCHRASQAFPSRAGCNSSEDCWFILGSHQLIFYHVFFLWLNSWELAANAISHGNHGDRHFSPLLQKSQNDDLSTSLIIGENLLYRMAVGTATGNGISILEFSFPKTILKPSPFQNPNVISIFFSTKLCCWVITVTGIFCYTFIRRTISLYRLIH